ncbi:MAG TPA: hypothetical protein VGK02_10725 [Candidatus Aquicultor sp.]
MRKIVILVMAAVILLCMSAVAFALQDPPSPPATVYKGNIVANTFTPVGANGAAKDYRYFELGQAQGAAFQSYATSTHVYGTWNSPFTAGVDGYNYNDAQDYVGAGDQTDFASGNPLFQAGPHGGYLTTTHRCRECHAVHRASGRFKLLRSDTRFEACDWCHSTGAGSGHNIEMDNNDLYTTEYNVGHTLGYGIDSGKWKAPDDTYPAFTPNYYLGGFSCFDCHSPHANPQRMLGYNSAGIAVGLLGTDGKRYGIADPGHDSITAVDSTHIASRPVYLSGSWLLIKDPDQEIASSTGLSVSSGITGDPAVSWAINGEIPDVVTAGLNEFDSVDMYPVNKIAIDWSNPVGAASGAVASTGFTTRNTTDSFWSVTEFCTDCHDGNAGLNNVAVPMFSEDRALRGQTTTGSSNGSVCTGTTANWKGSYDIGYAHDEQSRNTCQRQMLFNPEDNLDYGPNCRNCHRGSSACGTCHNAGAVAYTDNAVTASDNSQNLTTYIVTRTSTGDSNAFAASSTANMNGVTGFYRVSRTVAWDSGWRLSPNVNAPVYDAQGYITQYSSGGNIAATCSDNGFSWPHRTLGWKLLKDDLFGINFDGSPVSAGQARTIGGMSYTVHDLDSVCLDCHNPRVWRATSPSNHTDATGSTADDYNDELLLRGLP